MKENGIIIPFPEKWNNPLRVREDERPPYGGKLPQKADIIDLEEYKKKRVEYTPPKLLT